MATTTNYGWTTPDDTALVKDGAAAIRTLGSSIDTTTKALNPSTTLGDIEYRSSSANTNTRLPIGSTGQVLTVNGGVPSWASVGGTPPFLVAPVSGWYLKPFTNETYSQDVPTLNTTYYIPIYLPATTFDRISIRTGASHTGTSTNRLGLYNVSSTTGRPTTVVFDAGTVSATAANTNFEITISQTVSAGFYYLAINQQSSTGNGHLNFVSTLLNSTGVNNSYNGRDVQQTFSQSGVTGAFATAGTLSANYLAFITALRMA